MLARFMTKMLMSMTPASSVTTAKADGRATAATTSGRMAPTSVPKTASRMIRAIGRLTSSPWMRSASISSLNS
jgi:hypothetical protein